MNNRNYRLGNGIEMKIKQLNRITCFLIGATSILLISFTGICQEAATEIKDNSKPTNVYSQLDGFLEFTRYSTYNTFGINPRLTYTPNADNALILEVPLLYSTLTDKFGLSDMRLRYFWIPYRDYTKTFGSFGASMDIFIPTGSYENGLGSSSWRFSPGITFGLILNKSQTISLFPVISYIYTSKPGSDLIPEELREVDHGMNIQVISSFILNENVFLLITPVYDMKDLQDEREDEFFIEIEPTFDIMKDKYQIGAFYRGAFQSNVHTVRLFFTIFL